jgi:serine O-acetyltransferase
MNNEPNFSLIAPLVVQKVLEYQAAFPSRRDARLFAESILQAVFPHFASERRDCSEASTEQKLRAAYDMLLTILTPFEHTLPQNARAVANAFFQRLPSVYESLWLDAEAILQGDPAANTYEEVILSYPGFLATAVYRIAHEFHRLGVPLFPRLLAGYAHSVTGVDIHPAAEIGERLCVDHGTGIVIGETAKIGSNVKIYQGVTLGALSVDKSLAAVKRHPTIEDDVVIYSNATILGGKTVIGAGSVIGGNVWLTESVPPRSVVYHKSEISLRRGQDNSDDILQEISRKIPSV